MQLNRPENKLIVPMSYVCRQWQQSEQLDMSWYFEMAQSFGAKKLLLNAVQINSPLFIELNKQLTQYELQPEYVITAPSLCEIENLQKLLNKGISFTVLFYSPLSADFVEKIRGLKEYLNLFNFVVIARKDWNVRNTFRSIPYFMREKLFVDFPTSIHSTDPFYTPEELDSVIKKFESDFLDTELKSYCPNLRLRNEWVEGNVSHFSRPRKLTNTKPVVSIIARDPENLQALLNSKAVKESPEKFEIIVTRVAGQKTKVIPKIKSMTTTRYWAHPKEQDKPISQAMLDNFSGTQADGEYLFFLNAESPEEIEPMLMLLTEGQLNVDKLMLRRQTLIFKRTDFCSVLGFDELIQSPKCRDLDISIRLARLKKKDTLKPYFTSYLDQDLSFEDELDHKLVLHKFIDSVNDFEHIQKKQKTEEDTLDHSNTEAKERARYKSEQARQVYLSLYKATPRVTIEGHFAYIKEPVARGIFRLKHFVKMHAWKLNPKRLEHILNLHMWKFKPQRYPIFWKVLWKFNPKSYALYWKLPYFPMKIKNFMSRVFFFIFKISFPVRKVYYVLNYQYEKRILGLHQKANSSGGR